jgi:hypothetical protein
MIIKQSKTYNHGRRSVLTASERKTYQLSLHDDIKAGYPLEKAKERAWDCVYAQRRVAAGTFKSKWGL